MNIQKNVIRKEAYDLMDKFGYEDAGTILCCLLNRNLTFDEIMNAIYVEEQKKNKHTE